MFRPNSSGFRAMPCAVAVLLAGCGGNGYGGGGMNGNMGGYGGGTTAPKPAVTFSAPAQPPTIHLGQSVKLTWTSSYATSCSATTSSDIGGAFAGSQPTSGSATVAPVGTGTVTYMLSCTGSGGTGSATSAAVTVQPSILSMLSPATITTIGTTVDPI